MIFGNILGKNRKKVTGSCKLQQIRGTQIVGPQKVWIAAVELVVLQILEKFKVGIGPAD